MIKNIALTILLVLAVYLGFQVKNLNKAVSKLKEACGDKCGGLFVEFNVSGLGDALDKTAVDKTAIKACLDSSEMVERVNKDFNDAQELGISGTPGNLLLNKETGLAVLIPGAFPLEILEIVKGKLLDVTIKENDTVYENAENKISLKVKKFPAMDEITDSDNIKGPKDAKIALVEYSDFDCPYCKTFHVTANEFVTRNTDAVWVFRHYPLRSAHPDAQKKAEAAECVKKLSGQEKFWEFTDALYQASR